MRRKTMLVALVVWISALVTLLSCRAGPTPSPATPTPTPVVAATPTPAAIATPTPARVATPTPTPVVAATPTPAAIATPTPARVATPTPTVAATPIETPRRGGILEYIAQKVPASWDVYEAIPQNIYITGPIFSQLVRFNPALRTPSEIIPDLAERWELSPDGRVYTFHLRRGVKWHDGKPFTAVDVKYSLEKMADPKRSALAGNFVAFQRAEIVDDYTVRAYLSRPQASYLTSLAVDLAQIHAAHIAGAGVDSKSTKFLVGTGAFKLSGYTAGVTIELVRNPDYYLPGLPYLNGLRLYVITDATARLGAFVGKRVQMLHPQFGIGYDVELAAVRSGAPEAVVEPFYSTMPFGLVGKLKAGEPWNDMRVRKAISLAMKRLDIGNAVYGGTNWIGGDVLGFFPYASAYAVPEREVTQRLGLDKPYDERLSQARRLMAEAGYPQGFKARVLIRPNDSWRRSLIMLDDQLRSALGIQLVIDEQQEATALAMRKKGQWELHWETLMRSYTGEPDELLSALLSGSPLNYGGYSNPTYDSLFEKQSSSLDPEQRKQIIREMQLLLLDDLPFIPTVWSNMYSAWYPEVRGYHIMGPGYFLGVRMDMVWLAK